MPEVLHPSSLYLFTDAEWDALDEWAKSNAVELGDGPFICGDCCGFYNAERPVMTAPASAELVASAEAIAATMEGVTVAAEVDGGITFVAGAN